MCAVTSINGVQVPVKGSALQRSESQIPSELQDSHAGDTFRAFTETVEALALQKSVIGEIRVYFRNHSSFTFTYYLEPFYR